MEKQIFTVPEAATALGLHAVTLYRGLADGSIPLRYIRIGRRIIVPQHAVAEFLAAARPGGRRPGRPRKGGV